MYFMLNGVKVLHLATMRALCRSKLGRWGTKGTIIERNTAKKCSH